MRLGKALCEVVGVAAAPSCGPGPPRGHPAHRKGLFLASSRPLLSSLLPPGLLWSPGPGGGAPRPWNPCLGYTPSHPHMPAFF